MDLGASHRNRPVTLTVLCILSFLGSGLAFFTYSMISFSYEEFMLALQETGFDVPQVEIIRQASKGFFVSGTILYATSLVGVMLMWRLRKAGFHFYAAAQVLVALHPWIFLKMESFPLLSLMASAIFILLYAYHLRYMN